MRGRLLVLPLVASVGTLLPPYATVRAGGEVNTEMNLFVKDVVPQILPIQVYANTGDQ